MIRADAALVLGVDPLVGDRALLGLAAEGDLRSGQIESALAGRLSAVDSHPRARSASAEHARAVLESAADRLQAELALAGRGPLHPAAARRAAARMHPPPPPRVTAPAAITRDEIVHGSQLTDFDRLALAVLVVSRGWNARSAKRLAAVAGEYGVSVEDLERVVLGLTEFLARGEGLRSAIGEVGADARRSWMQGPRTSRADEAEHLVERVFTRLDGMLRDELHDGRTPARVRLVAAFVLFALSWFGALIWLFNEALSGGGGDADAAPAPALVSAEEAFAGPSGPAAPQPAGDTDANGRPVAPIAPLAAPAKFPRPPGFNPAPAPPEALALAQESASILADLEELRRSLVTNGGRLDGANLAVFADAMARGAASWPLLGDRASGLRAAVAGVARAVRGTESVLRLVDAVPGGEADGGSRGAAVAVRCWRAPFGAGVLASIALDGTQPPEMASAAREELRRRSIALPRGLVEDAFGEGAVWSLRAIAPPLAESLALGTEDLAAASRWTDAVRAAASTDELRTSAWLAAIEACLRAPGALDKPGPLVDLLAHAIQALDFTGRGGQTDRVRDAVVAWILDPSIPSTRVWVFTSLLDQDLAIAWFGPDLVLATDADAEARRVLAGRVEAAFPTAQTTNVGEAILVERKTLEKWRADIASIRASKDDSAAARLRVAALAIVAARVGHAFTVADARRAAEADGALTALMRREIGEWAATPSGERAGLPAAGVGDGEFAREWNAAVGDREKRVSLARGLATRPATGDLGPIDARVAATEALRSNVPEVRAALCGALADRFGNGPVFLGAVLDALADGTSSRDAADFLSRLTGERIGGSGWPRRAREALLARLHAIRDGDEHMLDLAAGEIATHAMALAAEVRGARTAGAVSAGTAPDVALSIVADALRDEAAARFLSAPFPAAPEEIERTRAARRALARGTAQRMAAETPAVLDHAAAVVVARQPELRSAVGEILAAARRARASAASATAQCAADLEALLEVLSLQFAAAPDERSDA